MNRFAVVYDACVLYPAPLRDLLMHLALLDLYRAKWTNAIHDEWIGSLLENRPELKPEQLQRTRELMNRHVRDSLVTDFEDLIEAVELPDPNDRHVLAAAIRSGAQLIITFNLKHFPSKSLKQYGIEAQHPDDFLAYQLGLAPHVVCTAAKRHRKSLRNPPKSVSDYLSALVAQGLTQTASELLQFSELI